MAVTMAEITKLRHLTSAGLMDCKKALAETNGDIDAAVEILRKKGQAVAAKREDREASEGCSLSASDGTFAAIVALKCETDFVAKNAGFVETTRKILNVAMECRPNNIEELKALTIDGQTIQDLVVEESGKTGEKMEIGAYEWVKAESTTAYDHLGNKLSTIVGFNQADVDYQLGRDVAMQVASMNPVAVSIESVPASVVETEYKVAVDKTKEEQVKKAVEAALKKAGSNPNLVDSHRKQHRQGMAYCRGGRQGACYRQGNRRAEGCQSACPDDREYRKGSRQQVLQGVCAHGAGVHQGCYRDNRSVSRQELEGTGCS